VKRLTFYTPQGPLTPEAVSAQLAAVGIEREVDDLAAISDLELVLLFDYAQRLALSSGDGKVPRRPRPAILDRMPAGDGFGARAAAR